MSPTLSDRIIASASDLKEQWIAKPYCAQMILKGDAPNGKIVLSKFYMILNDFKDKSVTTFKYGVKKSETAEEKQIFEQLIVMSDVALKRYDTLFKERFGSLESVSVDNIIKHPLVLLLVEEAANAPITELLVRLLSTFYALFLMAGLKLDPGFAPNWYYDYHIADYGQIEGVFNVVKALIDSREGNVSDVQENYLMQVFRRTLAFQINIGDLVWN